MRVDGLPLDPIIYRRSLDSNSRQQRCLQSGREQRRGSWKNTTTKIVLSLQLASINMAEGGSIVGGERSLSGNQQPECRMINIGKVGVGKSALGNSILGKEAFISDLCSQAVSFKCEEQKALRFNRILQVIDTPGLFDIGTSVNVVINEIVRCITMTLPGPHCFIIVIRISRFTPEDKCMVDTFAKIFGEGMFKHAVVVFTGEDELEKHKKTLEDFLSKVPKELKDLLTKCDNRVLAINNLEEQTKKDRVIRKLLQIIDKLGVYSNEAYEALLKDRDLAKSKPATINDLIKNAAFSIITDLVLDAIREYLKSKIPVSLIPASRTPVSQNLPITIIPKIKKLVVKYFAGLDPLPENVPTIRDIICMYNTRNPNEASEFVPSLPHKFFEP